MLGNGVCDSECLNAACSADLGDCQTQACSAGCYSYMVGDGLCQTECHNSACQWDLYDCDCSPGCTADLLANSVCDSLCNTALCGFDSSLCVSSRQGQCASGCFASMLGNGLCDSVCYSAACAWDGLDCGCAPDCHNSEYGSCKPSCLVPDCNYDQMPGFSQCPNTGLRTISQFFHLGIGDFSVPLTYKGNCGGTNSMCTSTKFTQSQATCISECDKLGCGYSAGYCPLESCASKPRHCLDCGLSDGSGCVNCEVGTFHLYRSCVSVCPVHFHIHPLVPDLCFPDKDYTSRSSPAVYIVSPTSNPEGTGTLSNPLDSLSTALLCRAFNHTRIELLPGLHYLKLVAASSTLQAWGQLLPYLFTNTSLTITKAEHHSAPVLLLYENLSPVQVTIHGQVTIANLTLLGNSTLVQDCTGPKCLYCAVLSIDPGTSQATDDQGLVYPLGSYAVPSDCERFRYYSFFYLATNASFTLSNTTITGFSQGLGSLISLKSGHLHLIDVQMSNISTQSSQTAFLSGQFIPNAVIQQNSSNSVLTGQNGTTYEPGSILLQRVKVTLLNNGFELKSDLIQYGFLSVNGIRNVIFQNCDFSDSIVQSGSLISVLVAFSISLDHCAFSFVYVENYLLRIAPTGILALTPDLSDFYHSHISIRDCSFRNVAAVPRASLDPPAGSLIAISVSGPGLNILLSSLSFLSCLSSYALITASSTNPRLSDSEKHGTFARFTTISGSRLTLAVPQLWTYVSSTLIRDSYAGGSLIAFSKLVNVEMDLLDVGNSGDGQGVVSPATVVISDLIGKLGVYLSKSTIGVTLLGCAVPISFNQCYNATIHDGKYSNSTCLQGTLTSSALNTGFGGFRASLHTGPFVLSRFSMSDFSAPSVSGGTCLTLVSAGQVDLKDLTVRGVTNPAKTGTGLMVFALTGEAEVRLEGVRVEGTVSIGPVLQVTAGFALVIVNSVFHNNLLKASSIVYFLPMVNNTWSYISISHSLFTNNQGGDGAIVYLSNIVLAPVPLSLTISACQFHNNTSFGVGLALYLDPKSYINPNSTVENCVFEGNAAKEALLGLYFLSGSLTVGNCTFRNNIATGSGLIVVSPVPQLYPVFHLLDSTLVANSGLSLIKVTNPNGAESVSTRNNSYLGNFATIWNLDRTEMTDAQSLYAGNQGSALHCTTLTQLAYTETVFRAGNSSLGGAVFLSGGSEMRCEGCVFEDNWAGMHGGGVYIEQESRVDITNGVFRRNKAGQRGAAIFLFGSSANSTVLSATFVENDSGDSGTVVVISGNLALSLCHFQANTGRKTAGLSAYFSVVSVSFSTISRHIGLSSPFIYSALESAFVVRNSSISDLSTSSAGGFLYALSSSFTISGCVFARISARNGPIVLSNAGSVFAISDSEMREIGTEFEFGGVLAWTSGMGNATNLVLEEFTGGGIVAADLTYLNLLNVSISRNHGLSANASYGGLYCYGCTQLSLTSCRFSSLFSEKGPAVFLLGGPIQSPDSTSVFHNCSFHNLSSHTGGVYISDMDGRFYGSRFEDCRADVGNGGALALLCAGRAGGCEFKIEECEFRNNSAAVAGGSVYWADSMPQVTNSVFRSGKAAYGPDFASFPVRIRISALTGNGSLQADSDSEATLFNMASGQLAAQSLLASVTDHYGQVVTTENSAAAALLVTNQDVNLFGVTAVVAVNGTFAFVAFGISANPLSTAYFHISTTAIDVSKQAAAQDNATYNQVVGVKALMRACVMGESRFENQCLVCPAGKYSLSPETSCQDCSAKAICYGNFTMVPRAGYWRSSVHSDTFWLCPYQPACVGSPAPPGNLSLTGNCATGYYGNLCNGCLSGFSRLNQHECGLCPSFVTNLLRTIGVGCAFLLALVIIVATAIKSAYRTSSYFSIYMKVLLNYLQLIMMTANFDLNWPSYLHSFIQTQQVVGNVSDQVFSIDCFFQSEGQEDQGNAVRMKIVLLSFLPLLMWLLGAVWWLPFALVTRKYSYLKNELVTTSVVFFFLIHPSLVKLMFAFFYCKQLDPGQYWLTSCLNIRCWDSVHLKYALSVALPSIVVWGLGLPTLCLAYLIRERNRLGQTTLRLRLGFLYNGYEREKFYWELLILYRKVTIIAITVFLGNVSTYVQALSALLVILAAFALQSKHAPYIESAMDELELRGILVGGATVYGGLYSLSGDLSSWALISIFILIVGLNAYFLAYWGYRVVLANWKIITLQVGKLRHLLTGWRYRVLPKALSRSAIQQEKSSALAIDEVPSFLQPPDNSPILCEPSSAEGRVTISP